MTKWILLALVFCSASFACDHHGSEGITIENSLWIGPHDKNAAGISEKEFNEAIDEVESIYKEIVADHGASLKIFRKWDDGTVNAYAKQDNNVFEVHMFGGLARHETITADGFRLVVCHELGHHLGGAPRKTDWFGSVRWAANEGQADYWGVSKCFRKVLEHNGDSLKVVKKMDVDPAVTKSCSDKFADAEQAAICVRSALAGNSLSSLFHALRGLTDPLSYTTKDPAVVKSTFHGHPLPQCRLDTYFEAALCDIDSSIDTDMDDVNIGTCNRTKGDETGLRPLCWFNPEQYN